MHSRRTSDELREAKSLPAGTVQRKTHNIGLEAASSNQMKLEFHV